jgi:hypothetical protein
VPIEGVVADSNVLLSAAVAKAALRVTTSCDVVVHVAQFNADEVAEYLPLMATKHELQIELVEMQWTLLPLRIHPLRAYQARFSQAIEDLKHRDPQVGHALALAGRWAYRFGPTTEISKA